MTTELYPASRRPLDPAVLAAPPAVYRGAPFWSLNGRLDPAALARGVDQFADMGMGGFHLHPRTGLATPYLSPDFFTAIRGAIARGRELGLIPWLYDEDRWPSGFAGGLVTRDMRFRRRFLSFRPVRAAQHPEEQPLLLAAYRVRLDAAGRLTGFDRLPGDPPEGDGVWYACRHINGPWPWYGDQTYVDVLNPAAIARFIEVTHAAYLRELGPDFGGAPAIFTDEPMIPAVNRLPTPGTRQEIQLPWTDDLPDTYRARWGEDLLDHLPELLWDRPAPCPTRWRFLDHVTERFANAYADQIGAWCEQHGLISTGHLMDEVNLGGQESALGEAMRHYRGYQLPGIDMLCDRQELTTAKQAVSVARQDGRAGALSELYGVMDWDPTFGQHKTQGDWQAALGITVRVHHLVHHTLGGDAKRDYPASLGRHWPAHARYRLIEDHFARVNACLTRGRAHVRVAVVHPIESRWVGAGNDPASAMARHRHELLFADLTTWLVDGLIDFDFVSESLLPAQCPQGGAPLAVGAMRYDAVILPDLATIRSTTLDRLEAFVAAGGRLITLGAAPALVDALPSGRAAALCRHLLPADRGSVLTALESLREFAVDDPAGQPRGGLVHQLRREDDGTGWLFLTCRHRPQDGDPPVWWESHPVTAHDTVRIRGRWTPRLCDTADGTLRSQAHWHADGWTCLPWRTMPQAHLLLRLEPAAAAAPRPAIRMPTWGTPRRLVADPVPVTLHEPNVLLLDRAAWSLDGGAWQEPDEILRLDDRLRTRLGWQGRRNPKIFAQPWARAASTLPTHRVALRTAVTCNTPCAGCRLVLERSADAIVRLDGAILPSTPTGWWIDEALTTIALPDLAAGEHALEVELPFTDTAGLEWMYVLGDFSVALRGRHARLGPAVRELAWGDICTQGLPFYGGDLTYHTAVDHHGPAFLRVVRMGAPVAEVSVDGGVPRPLAWWPHRADLGTLRGRHRLDLRVFGNRRNQLGPVHNASNTSWVGPGAWYSVNDHWTDGYVLRPTGMLIAPEIEEPAS